MWLEHLRQDARYASRSFARSPLFTLTAVLSLAIGIGADTAVFSVANALLLRSPSGVNEPDRLVDISVAEGGSFGIDEVSFPNYLDIRLQASTIGDVYGYAPFPEPMSVSVSDGAERVLGHKVTTNYFDVLGVGAAAGRLFDTDPGRRAEAEQTVVLSHRYWTTRFHGDPESLGARSASTARSSPSSASPPETLPARASWRRTCGRRSRPSPRRIPTSPNAVSDGRCFADG